MNQKPSKREASRSLNNTNDNNDATIGKQADHFNNNINDNNNAIIQPTAIKKQAKNIISIKNQVRNVIITYSLLLNMIYNI